MKTRRIAPPRLAGWLLRSLRRYESEFSLTGDCCEEFGEIDREKGRARALWWIWRQVFSAVPSYFELYILFGGTMIKNYLKVAYRNFIRHKLFSFINVFGLAIGLAVCMVISLWVQREVSYDRFHEKSGRIYRVERELFRDNMYSRWPVSSGQYKQALLDDYPEIENAVRLWRREFSVRDQNNVIHRQELFAADNSLFDIFDFELKKGDETSALTEPMTVVMTRGTAVKYFGAEDPIGRTLSFEWEGEPVDFTVTGIVEEVPAQSHFHFDMLMSIASYPPERFDSIRSNYLYTYILLKKGYGRGDLEEKLKTFVEKRLEPYYGDLLSQGLGIHEVLKMHLFPITGIHLNPSVNWELEPGGNKTSVYIFSTIAVLILIIACLNFVNLSTARAGKRAKEVSLRKTVGAGRSQLRSQFLQESIWLVLAAMVLAFGLSIFLIYAYNRVFNADFSAASLFQPKNLLFSLLITLIVGILAGLYPAFYMTRFEPAGVLKGAVYSKGKSAFRRNMVVIQFVISTVLIFGMFTIYKQMRYIRNRNLGFDKENVLVVPIRSRSVAGQIDAFRSELLTFAHIDSVAASEDVPGESRYSNGSIIHEPSNTMADVKFFSSDYDFVDTYKMEILAGRNFSRQFSTDSEGVVLMNETAARKMGWTNEEAVGKKLKGGFSRDGVHVVGVLKNFNFKSLKQEVEAVVILLLPENISSLSIRILPGDLAKTMKDIERTWTRMFPGEQYDSYFLDSSIGALYRNEQNMQKLFIIFSALSILVACLGLLGLAVFTVELKTKEIGIRKTLGASGASVVLLLSKQFIKWVLIANVIAWPLAWFLMNRWLRSFAYRAEIGWAVFILTGLITLFIASATFIFQAFKAASANPADSLRYE